MYKVTNLVVTLEIEPSQHGSRGCVLHHSAMSWFQILVHFLQGPLGPSYLGHVQQYGKTDNKFYSRIVC